ncbi:hypothetical protein [Hymenobacter terricola]|uniref:hypothetical protein n=1 Tax=Hymenobacter terricola TaxID=2819236 RepID=UPI001B304AA8|nr:hypothetical protein [Hymenobacter terricola]
MLLERRAELQGLFDTLQYRIKPTEPDAANQLEMLAQRALDIIREWPDEFWPLESEENLWPDRPDVIEYLELDVRRAKDYQLAHPRPFNVDVDFDAYMELHREMFGALYWFRAPKKEDEHDDE